MVGCVSVHGVVWKLTKRRWLNLLIEVTATFCYKNLIACTCITFPNSAGAKVDCSILITLGYFCPRGMSMCWICVIYDQYAVLLLMGSTIYRVNIQSGHSKLVTYVADNAKSIHCNNTFIFIGVSRESGSQSLIKNILPFDRGSCKLWFLHIFSHSLQCNTFIRIANPNQKQPEQLT